MLVIAFYFILWFLYYVYSIMNFRVRIDLDSSSNFISSKLCDLGQEIYCVFASISHLSNENNRVID